MNCLFRRMKLKKELRAVKEINEQERKKRDDDDKVPSYQEKVLGCDWSVY